jgi:hypothetical protein
MEKKMATESSKIDSLTIGERGKLFSTLMRLSPSDFDALLFSLDTPPSVIPDASIDQSLRTAALLDWLTSQEIDLCSLIEILNTFGVDFSDIDSSFQSKQRTGQSVRESSKPYKTAKYEVVLSIDANELDLDEIKKMLQVLQDLSKDTSITIKSTERG